MKRLVWSEWFRLRAWIAGRSGLKAKWYVGPTKNNGFLRVFITYDPNDLDGSFVTRRAFRRMMEEMTETGGRR